MTPASRGGSPPSLAVIVVTYNSGAMLPECLAALDRAIEGIGPAVQSSVDLVVVDNASRDRPVVADSPLRTTRRLMMETNLGFSRGVNRGLLEVPTAERVLLLNPDARLAPDALRLLLHDMANTNALLAGPLLVDDAGRPHGVSERAFHSPAREAVRQLAPFSSRSEPSGGELRRPAQHGASAARA